MALQIDVLPDAPSRNDSRDVFSNKANLFAAALPNLVSQANALAEEVETKAGQVAEDRTAVGGLVDTAAGHASTASSQADIAQSAAASAAESAILAAASLSSKPIIQNTNSITENQIIPSGRNALSVGPIAINDGVTVTVAPGSRWRIL